MAGLDITFCSGLSLFLIIAILLEHLMIQSKGVLNSVEPCIPQILASSLGMLLSRKILIFPLFYGCHLSITLWLSRLI